MLALPPPLLSLRASGVPATLERFCSHQCWRLAQKIGGVELPTLLRLFLSISPSCPLSFSRRIVCCTLLSRSRCCFSLSCAATSSRLRGDPKLVEASTGHKFSRAQHYTNQLHLSQHEHDSKPSRLPNQLRATLKGRQTGERKL